MELDLDQQDERTRSALTTLSTVGAAIAGAAVGALLEPALRPIVWIVLAVGLASHLFGMIGVRRLLTNGAYQAPFWQKAAFWLCWVAIAVVVALVLFSRMRGPMI